jgi:hypothetical protein
MRIGCVVKLTGPDGPTCAGQTGIGETEPEPTDPPE